MCSDPKLNGPFGRRIQPFPDLAFIFAPDFHGFHPNGTVMGMIVSLDESLQDVDVFQRAFPSKVPPHARFESAIESFHDGRFDFAVGRIEMYPFRL